MRCLASIFLGILIFIPVFVFAAPLDDINHFRCENKLPPLKEDVLTCAIADFRLKQIQTDFSHSGFLALGLSNFAENLAEGYADPVPPWIASKTHRWNFLINAKNACVRGTNNFWVYIAHYE